LEAAIQKKEGAVLRKVDIKSWSSEAARQHGIQSIPQLWLYDGTKLVTTDGDRVMRWLME
jgi:hypothetical protein